MESYQFLQEYKKLDKGIKSSKLKVYGDLRWDGLIYNPHAEDKTDPNYVEGKFDPIAEGQYYYKFQYRLSPKYPYPLPLQH